MQRVKPFATSCKYSGIYSICVVLTNTESFWLFKNPMIFLRTLSLWDVSFLPLFFFAQLFYSFATFVAKHVWCLVLFFCFCGRVERKEGHVWSACPTTAENTASSNKYYDDETAVGVEPLAQGVQWRGFMMWIGVLMAHAHRQGGDGAIEIIWNNIVLKVKWFENDLKLIWN